MQSNDLIEVVTVGSARLLYSRMRLPFLRALRLYWRNGGRISTPPSGICHCSRATSPYW